MPILTKTIPAPPHFNFHRTVSYQTYGRSTIGADTYIDGVYSRVVRRGDRLFAGSVQQAGRRLWVSADGTDVTNADLEHAVRMFRRMLGLELDMPSFYAMLDNDPLLHEASVSLRGLRPARTESVFEALINAITAQQISSVVARMVRNALVTTYGTPYALNGQTLYAFPTPQALLSAGIDGLRALKLSGRKVEYVQEIASRTLDGTLDDARLERLEDEEAITELTRIRGIGRWTAQWALLRALGRADVLPEGDVALQKVVGMLYFNGQRITEQQLEAFGQERWKPYRGLATTYLFAYLRQQRLAAETAKLPISAQPG